MGMRRWIKIGKRKVSILGERDTQKGFKCWRKSCKNKDWMRGKELVLRKEEKDHFDYICPECKGVIICSNHKIKAEDLK